MYIDNYTNLGDKDLKAFISDILSKKPEQYTKLDGVLKSFGDYLLIESYETVGKRLKDPEGEEFVRWFVWLKGKNYAIFDSRIVDAKGITNYLVDYLMVSKVHSELYLSMQWEMFHGRSKSMINPCSMARELAKFLKYYALGGSFDTSVYKDAKVEISGDSLVKKLLFKVFIKLFNGRIVSDTEAMVQDRWAKIIPEVLDIVVSCCKEFSDKSSGLDKDIIYYASCRYFTVRFIVELFKCVGEFSVLCESIHIPEVEELYKDLEKINVDSIFCIDPKATIPDESPSITIRSISSKSGIC